MKLIGFNGIAALLCFSLFMQSTRGFAESVKINPTTLRKYLTQTNNSVLTELNQVQRAKDEVWLARTKLLPSLNLGAILSSAGSPGFALSSVSFLLPFLLPSNWINLRESKHLLQAEEVSYDLIVLNQYASAYSIYSTLLEEISLKEVYQNQYDALKKVQDIIQERYEAGLSTSQDLNQAKFQTNLALSQVSLVEETLKVQIASLRHALGISLKKQMLVEIKHLPASSYEDWSPQRVLNHTLSIAPENKQIQYLIASGQDRKWSKVWGFLTGGTLSSNYSSASNSSAFSPFKLSGTMNIGFDQVATYALSNDDIKSLEFRRREIEIEQTQIVESTLSSIREASHQLSYSKVAEENINKAYQIEFEKYEAGLTDLLHVFSLEKDVVTAASTRVKAQMDLDHQRINLHRLLITDQFSYLPTCKSGGNTSLLPKRPTLDQVCNGNR